MAQRPQLDASLVRKGDARPAESIESGQDDVPGVQKPEEGRGYHPVPAVVPPREGAPSGLRPAPKPVQRKTGLHGRVSVDVAEGLRIMAFMTRRSQEAILSKMIEEGLDRWNPVWRTMIPDQ